MYGGENLPRNKYPEETVQKILDASLKLFLEKGYEETTVLDIISEMGGLTRGCLLYTSRGGISEILRYSRCPHMVYESKDL